MANEIICTTQVELQLEAEYHQRKFEVSCETINPELR